MATYSRGAQFTRLLLDGAFSTQLLAPKVTVPTLFGPVPVMVPKETNRARDGLARALNGVQKTTVSVEDLEAIKVKLLQKIENGENVTSEDILQLHSLGEKAAKERDEMKTATENFIRSEAPKARASDLFSIPGGVNSTTGLARMRLSASNSEARADLVASRKKEKEEKQTAKAAKVREELENELETDLKPRSTTTVCSWLSQMICVGLHSLIQTSLFFCRGREYGMVLDNSKIQCRTTELGTLCVQRKIS